MRKTKLTLDTLTLRGLAEAIGVKVQQLSLEAKRSGFPSRKIKGKRVYVAADVIAWRAKNIRARKHDGAGVNSDGGMSERGGKGKKSLMAADDPLVMAMMSGQADPLTISRTAVQIASKMVGQGAVDGTLSGMDLDGLKKSLGELRGAEADYIELEKAKRNLIDRVEVEEMVGRCVGRLVKCLAILENSIGTEFAMWIGDPAVQALSSEERGRKVREFVVKTCREIRQMEADGVRKMIDAGGDDENQEGS